MHAPEQLISKNSLRLFKYLFRLQWSLLLPKMLLSTTFLLTLILSVIYSSNASTQTKPSELNPSQSKKTILKPFIATYMVTSLGLEGINITNSLSLNYTHDKNTHDKRKRIEYHFKSYSMSVGLLAFQKDETRDEQSRGFIEKNFVKPEKYNFLQLLDNEIQRDVSITFDWGTNTAINNHRHQDSRWKMSIPARTMDKLSYQLALMLKLADHPNKQFSFNIADGGKVKEYQFKILGEERVYTSLGSYTTLKIEHLRYQKNKNITLWCAPELNFLPVKIVQQESGKPDIKSILISYQEGLTGQ